MGRPLKIKRKTHFRTCRIFKQKQFSLSISQCLINEHKSKFSSKTAQIGHIMIFNRTNQSKLLTDKS